MGGGSLRPQLDSIRLQQRTGNLTEPFVVVDDQNGEQHRTSLAWHPRAHTRANPESRLLAQRLLPARPGRSDLIRHLRKRAPAHVVELPLGSALRSKAQRRELVSFGLAASDRRVEARDG